MPDEQQERCENCGKGPIRVEVVTARAVYLGGSDPGTSTKITRYWCWNCGYVRSEPEEEYPPKLP